MPLTVRVDREGRIATLARARLADPSAEIYRHPPVAPPMLRIVSPSVTVATTLKIAPPKVAELPLRVLLTTVTVTVAGYPGAHVRQQIIEAKLLVVSILRASWRP